MTKLKGDELDCEMLKRVYVMLERTRRLNEREKA